MNLQNLSTLVEGKLINSPSITSFEDVCFEANRVRRGDLFIALKHEDIQEAILNGAYGILFDKPTQITDQEIAWIKVQFLDRALLRLLRFHLIKKSPKVFSYNCISIKLASQMITSRKLLILNGSFYDHLQDLYSIEENQYILFSPENIDEKLFLDVKPLNNVSNSSIEIIKQTLFETSFIYDGIYYERQLLSPFFIPYLETVLQFFNENSIKYKMRDFSPVKHFQPVFVNIHFQIKEFGKSDTVLIFEPDFKLIKEQIKFLNTHANWAKIIYLVPKCKADNLSYAKNIFTYESNLDIAQILKNESYQFALIAQRSADLLQSPEFEYKVQQASLF